MNIPARELFFNILLTYKIAFFILRSSAHSNVQNLTLLYNKGD